ncbi:hypothetical protein V6N13_107677 [Hibiscus sabdariffa]
MRSCFAVFCPDFKSASQLREKAEVSSIAENRFDRVSNGIVDALKDHEDILEMGGVGKILSSASFNVVGNILVYSLDDKRIVMCDREAEMAKLTFKSDHAYVNNVFRAKIMPYTDDRNLITCAEDGEVRHARSLELKLGCWPNIREVLMVWPLNQEALIYFTLVVQMEW